MRDTHTFSLSELMKYLSLKDQSEGTKTRRGTWADDEEARDGLKKRAKAMLLEIEKRQRKRHKKVLF